jgi:hypothetical protein
MVYMQRVGTSMVHMRIYVSPQDAWKDALVVISCEQYVTKLASKLLTVEKHFKLILGQHLEVLGSYHIFLDVVERQD